MNEALASPVVTLPAAQRATEQRLLNAFLRERQIRDPRVEGARFQLALAASGGELQGTVTYWSVLGHHEYGELFWITEGGTTAQCGHADLVAAVLHELDADRDVSASREMLAAQIDNSVRRTARYLLRQRPARPSSPAELTRHSEQALLRGHPFHPTPKSAEGFSEDDLTAYAPELGASFALHYFAVAPDLLVEHRVAPGTWTPPEVLAALEPDYRDHALVPVHPWQAGHLLDKDETRQLVAAGKLVALGPLGRSVYPTSSVRTVCDPGFESTWKLPLHVRITNFVRTNPLEHARRAAEASWLIDAVRRQWVHEGFEVLIETGYRSLDHPDLAADFSVLYRENPFVARSDAPQVVAGLLEEQPDGGEPDLITYVREASGDGLPAEHVAEWLRCYLGISLLPMLAVWRQDGLSLEAHVQNSLVHLENGWPVRFFVRDMEGTSASRERLAHNGTLDSLPADSPVVYDDAEAWMRMKYYLITNHLGHLIHVLARHSDTDETRLWGVVSSALRGSVPDRYVLDLLRSPSLPAKANLISRFAGRGEKPLYVTVSNPMHEVNV